MPHIRNDGRSWTLVAETDHSKIEVSRLCREELEELFKDLVDEGFATAEIDRLQQEKAELQEELMALRDKTEAA
jgi:hypothetical protein